MFFFKLVVKHLVCIQRRITNLKVQLKNPHHILAWNTSPSIPVNHAAQISETFTDMH